ncbi:hypothetical protein [Rhodococcus sp. NPDC059234]|uniref:hypothetical protein n=1 Tax=Rhodococcus sp. NPDC059234 TaxID=3346781 RepID=UPI003672F193
MGIPMNALKVAAYTITLTTATLAGAVLSATDAAADAPAVNDAVVGSCLHTDSVPGPGETVNTNFSPATCGTANASIVVTSIVGDSSQCSHYYIENPDRGRVLCADAA